MYLRIYFVHSVLDSWGKFPSAIFSGNLYDLGGFAQCFDIKRDGKHYETQYCLGQIIIEQTRTAMNESMLYTVLETDADAIIEQTLLLPV